MIPLSFSPVGSEMTVKALGGKPELKRHLESLGFSNGTKVVVTSVISGNHHSSFHHCSMVHFFLRLHGRRLQNAFSKRA